MAGICGYITFQPVSLEDLLAMHQKIAHRGRDDHGLSGVLSSGQCVHFTRSDESVENILEKACKIECTAGIGFHRNVADDRWKKSNLQYEFNGARYLVGLDGFVLLDTGAVERLGIEKESVDRMDPAELFARAYHRWGLQFLEYVNGSFALAIFDVNKNELLIYRDKLATKPLYYWKDAKGTFYFSSEIKAFTGCRLWKPVLNKKRAFDYLVLGKSHHTNETLFEDVFCFQPGVIHILKCSDKNLKICKDNSYSKFFINQIKHQEFHWKNPKTIQSFKNSMIQAISDVLQIKGRKGIAFSGGLDSTAILMVSKFIEKKQGLDLSFHDTFSACSHNELYSEKPWMDAALKDIDMIPHYVYPTCEDVFSRTESLVYHLDEPYYSQRPLLSCMFYEEAARHRIQIMLNGSAADALLSNFILVNTQILYRHLVSGRLIHFLKILLSSLNVKFYSGLLLKIILPSFITNFLAKLKIQKNWEEIIDFNILGTLSQASTPIPDILSPQSFIQYFLQRPVQSFINNADKCAHMHGVEVYFPFVHHEVVQCVAQIKREVDFKNEQDKNLIKLAFGNLIPKTILHRKEKGHFTTAEKSWFLETHSEQFITFFKQYVFYSKGIIKEKAAIDYLQRMQKGQIPFDSAYWRIICFCVWMKVYEVRL